MPHFHPASEHLIAFQERRESLIRVNISTFYQRYTFWHHKQIYTLYGDLSAPDRRERRIVLRNSSSNAIVFKGTLSDVTRRFTHCIQMCALLRCLKEKKIDSRHRSSSTVSQENLSIWRHMQVIHYFGNLSVQCLFKKERIIILWNNSFTTIMERIRVLTPHTHLHTGIRALNCCNRRRRKPSEPQPVLS